MVAVSAYMGGTRDSGVLASAGDVLEMAGRLGPGSGRVLCLGVSVISV